MFAFCSCGRQAVTDMIVQETNMEIETFEPDIQQEPVKTSVSLPPTSETPNDVVAPIDDMIIETNDDEPDPNPPEPEPVWPITLVGIENNFNVYAFSNADSQVVAVMGFGQLAMADNEHEGWYHLTVLPGMYDGYAQTDNFAIYDDTTIYMAMPRMAATSTSLYNSDGVLSDQALVDVRDVIPDIAFHMTFATPYNFTGNTLYARDVPILRYGTVLKLKKAQELFALDGYGIKIYDAYRPASVSGILFSIIGDSNYIAPAWGSVHNRAAAIDMTLIDADGNELEMPSPMHTLDQTSNRGYRGMTDTARSNMDYMASIMAQCGFTTVYTEWWHFSDASYGKYAAIDLPFTEFRFRLQEN